MTRILFICHGNICRSPMAEFVMKYLVKQKGLEDRFFIDSAATSTEEIGSGVHYGTRHKLKEVGIPCGEHRARQLVRSDYEKYDYLIGMDEMNIRNIKRIVGEDTDGRVRLLLSFAGINRAIADPWYTGNFDETYEDVLCGCRALLKYLL